MNRRVLIGAVGASLLLAGVGLAQPGAADPEQPRRPREAAATRSEDPAQLRARLERTIARTESMLERHREALERLDAGESPAEVMRSLRSREPLAEDGSAGGSPARGPNTEGPGPRGGGGPEGESGGGGRTGIGGPMDRTVSELTPETRRRLRAFLRDQIPSVHEQLAEIEQQDRAMGDTLFDRMIPQLHEIVTEMDRNPAFGALKLEEMRTGLGVVDATQHLRSLPANASPETKAAAETALRDAIAARFDARMKMREHELERLAARISELHEQIKEERAGRDAEIETVYESVIAQRWARPSRGPSEQRTERP